MTVESPFQFPVRQREGKWEVIVPPEMSDAGYVQCQNERDARTIARSWLLWGECVTKDKVEWPASAELETTAKVLANYGFGNMSRFFQHRLEDLQTGC